MKDAQFYIKVVDGVAEQRLYTVQQVRNEMQKLGYILPGSLNDSLLNQFDYYSALVINHQNYLTNKGFTNKGFTKLNLKRIYQEEGQWYVEADYQVDNSALEREWAKVSTERTLLLQQTDWIENSSLVTADTKRRYKAYRDIVRQLSWCIDYPADFKPPTPPEIKYVASLEKAKSKKQRELLSDEEVEKLKDYVPQTATTQKQWNTFIAEWSKLGLTKDRNIVSSLILMCTSLTLDQVLVPTTGGSSETTDVL